MKLQIENLLRELERLALLNRELADACKQKLSAMRLADARAIEQCTSRERQLVEGIRRHEARRRAICDGLASRMGVPAGETCRLTRLAGAFPEPYASRALSLATSMKRSMNEIRQLNRVNEMVAREVNRSFGDALVAISEATTDNGTYARTGRFAKQTGAPLFSATA